MLEKITAGTVKGKALNELQAFRTAVVAGDSADVLVVVPGMGINDTIQSVLAMSIDEEVALSVEDLSAFAEVSVDEEEDTVGVILTDEEVGVDTAGKTLVIHYWSKPVSTIVINPVVDSEEE